MRYIERVVWKSTAWLGDGLDHGVETRPGRPHGLVVDLGDGRMLMASAPHGGSSVTIGVTGGLRISIPAERAEDVAEAILYAHRWATTAESGLGVVSPAATLRPSDGQSAVAS